MPPLPPLLLLQLVCCRQCCCRQMHVFRLLLLLLNALLRTDCCCCRCCGWPAEEHVLVFQVPNTPGCTMARIPLHIWGKLRGSELPSSSHAMRASCRFRTNSVVARSPSRLQPAASRQPSAASAATHWLLLLLLPLQLPPPLLLPLPLLPPPLPLPQPRCSRCCYRSLAAATAAAVVLLLLLAP